MWDLVSRPRIEPPPPTLEVHSLSHGTSPFFFLKGDQVVLGQPFSLTGKELSGKTSGKSLAFLFSWDAIQGVTHC